MKTCPQCRATYQDPTLNFCLEDGTPLQAMPPSGQSAPPAAPSAPAGQVTFGNPQSAGGLGQPASNFTMQPPRKTSSPWLWVAGIVGVLGLLCVGSFIVLGVLGYAIDGTKSNSNLSSKKTDDKEPESPVEKSAVSKFDFAKWKSTSNEFAELDVSSDSASLMTKKPGYYYVVLTGSPMSSFNGGASVSVSNLSGVRSSYGYGLVFHSTAEPLTAGYAFLIDSERGQFKVVKHKTKTETDVSSWKKSDAIQSGSAENVLEIRDEGDRVKCYINGTEVYDFRDEFSAGDGTVGIYGSSAKIRFSEISSWK